MGSTEDEFKALATLDALFGGGDHQHYTDALLWIETYSMDWLVELAHKQWPNMMRISVPSMLSACVALDEPGEGIDLHGKTWGEVKRSITKAVSDYLR